MAISNKNKGKDRFGGDSEAAGSMSTSTTSMSTSTSTTAAMVMSPLSTQAPASANPIIRAKSTELPFRKQEGTFALVEFSVKLNSFEAPGKVAQDTSSIPICFSKDHLSHATGHSVSLLTSDDQSSNVSLDADVTVSIESLRASLVDTNWKLRKGSYILLRQILQQESVGLKAGHVNSNSVIQGLDSIVPLIIADKNANALDFGLQFALDYAHYCSGATAADQASLLVSILCKGGIFATSRISTGKLCSALALKLIEVGSEGNQSAHSVINVLLDLGLSSRKPKEVLTTTIIIHEAALDFGADCLPIAAIKSNASKMLSHSNASVRDSGMKVLAEICRVLGSQKPLQDVLDNLKKGQLAQLTEMVETHPYASSPRVGLRNSKSLSSPAFENPKGTLNVLAAFEEQAKELKAKRFAERPAVNLLQEVSKSDYSNMVKLPKWSEKVSALDTLLGCGGEKPYKLVQPSSLVNYSPLIAEMRMLLSHTHFTVVSKAMMVLTMIAEGIGEKIFPSLRPLLTTILQLSKDKKLTKNVASCVDSLFGNVFSLDHLLEKDDAVTSLLDEQKQKNALVRLSSLEYLCRCSERAETAGPRGVLTARSVTVLTELCISKLGDCDAAVRKVVLHVLRSLLSIGNESIVLVVDRAIDGLKTDNPRVYASLKCVPTQSSKSIVGAPKPLPVMPTSTTAVTCRSSQDKQVAPVLPNTVTHSQSKADLKTDPIKDIQDKSHESIPTNTDDALSTLSILNIPNFDGSEDDGGVLECLKGNTWQSRQQALRALGHFCDSENFDVFVPSGSSSAIIFLVKEFTKNFKESNFNIVKATMELMMTLCSVHARKEEPFPNWACTDIVFMCVDKITDKKLAECSLSLLSDLCTVTDPKFIVGTAFRRVLTIKAPATHESLMKWTHSFCVNFGTFLLTAELKTIISYLLEECEHSNIQVRKAAYTLVGEVHSQLGPSFRALILASAAGQVKVDIVTACDEKKFDPNACNVVRSRRCVVARLLCIECQAMDSSIKFEAPKMDLASEIGAECIAKMGSKEGKTAWKLRKEAMDEVEKALKKCNGMLSTIPLHLKTLVELLRALKERLSDSQSNLKPLAARLIGSVLSRVDKVSQGNLGKLVFAPLLNAAISDGRKPMREASLKALSDGTISSEHEGGEPNGYALESLLVAFVGEVGSAEIKANGLPDVIHFLVNLAPHVPDLDGILGVRAQPLGEKFAAIAIDCLASSKGETRTAAEDLLRACLQHKTISAQTLRTGLDHLKPAQQRTVSPILAGLVNSMSLASVSPRAEKENRPIPELCSRSVIAQSTAKPKQTASRLASSSSAPVSHAELSKNAELKNTEIQGKGHPLGSTSSGMKKLRLANRHSWPDYPEEPSGTVQLSSLRKVWIHILPSAATAALFPEGGIKQQEDAHGGCSILSLAIHADLKAQTDEIVKQLDLIIKWISIALCSREKTVGLQAILSLLLILFNYLGEMKYTMLDDEASVLIPLIMEKASIAKGRFRETFHDVLSLLNSSGVISDKTFGSLICVSVIERSQQTKARVLALQRCSSCIERIGLVAIGKKGLLLTTKALSDEVIPENRTAALDLLEVVLSKMNGDVDKLARICGPNLSNKSRAMLEERCNRRGGNRVQEAYIKAPTLNAPVRPQGRLVPPKAKSVSSGSRAENDSATHHRTLEREGRAEYTPVKSVLRTSLDLRLGVTPVSSSPVVHRIQSVPSDGPFSFSFNPGTAQVASADVDTMQESTLAHGTKLFQPVLTNSVPEFKASHSIESQPTPTGAAASLRARLLKIRDKHRGNDNDVKAPPVAQFQADQPEKESDLSTLSPVLSIGLFECSGDIFEQASEIILQLLRRPGPVSEGDYDIQRCISVLKKFHGAVSTSIHGLESDEQKLRKMIESRTTETVEHLSGVLGYAFTCGPEEKDAGMSVPLLSVALATLMALFRDESFARKVSQDALTLLIRETGQALLDSRLSVSSHRVSSLDESTGSQMVRAINKLAVQASTSSARHTSLGALMSLQQQLLLQETETPNATAFNRRISRIVTKLFGKVIKAEQGEVDPFSSATVDMDALICAIEDMLVAVHDDPRAPKSYHDTRLTCESMATVLLQAMISARGDSDIRELMAKLSLNSSTHLSSLIDSLSPLPNVSSLPSSSLTPSSPSPSKQAVSKDVASLVSAVASARDGVERDHAAVNLRRHREQHGDEDLTAHLSNVSSTFRSFVLQHLNETPSTGSYAVGEGNVLNDGTAVSDRLRTLRSKLHAPETTTSSVDPVEDVVTISSPILAIPRTRTSFIPPVLPSSPRQTSPTQISMPKLSTPSKSKSISSLRQRLAAAQQSRVRNDEGETKSAYGHAAALRARLEAVKKQNL